MATYSHYSPKPFDDFNTPVEIWKDIEKYIPKDKEIWCPFYFNGDHKLKELGFDIIHNQEDFFKNNRGEIIIDNPPFSIKKHVLKRMIEIDKPFMLIMPVSTLCYQYFNIYKDKIQILVPSKRYDFLPDKKASATFDCLWYCYKMKLDKDITFL